MPCDHARQSGLKVDCAFTGDTVRLALRCSCGLVWWAELHPAVSATASVKP